MSTYRQPGLVLTDHVFRVPLNHQQPGGERIEVYAREVVAADRVNDDLPWLLFLQGGPGAASPRPIGRETWLDRALEEYRVLLLDQRGTGRSTLAGRHILRRLGSEQALADYLVHFRADSIVRDAEIMRRTLLGDKQWSVLGQSFGGFCTVTYLSFAPEGLREAFITGGLPGLDATADDVYRATYPRVAAKNAAYYERYPDDVDRTHRIARFLRDHEVRLPAGGILTVEGFQALGQMLGSSTGADRLHYLLEDAFLGGDEPSDTFLYRVENNLTFGAVPLYAVLHEACYAQDTGATRWAAQRIRAEFPEFDADAALSEGSPVLFTGEMIYPWMFEIDPPLRPLQKVADLLAERKEWPHLYDSGQLRANEVPVAAAVYYDDMYVDRDLSMRTAEVIRRLSPWVTNEYEHDGLRVSNGAVLNRLIARTQGR